MWWICERPPPRVVGCWNPSFSILMSGRLRWWEIIFGEIEWEEGV